MFFFFFVEYLAEYDRKGQKHVGGSIYDCVLCRKLLCSCWFKHSKIAEMVILKLYRKTSGSSEPINDKNNLFINRYS